MDADTGDGSILRPRHLTRLHTDDKHQHDAVRAERLGDAIPDSRATATSDATSITNTLQAASGRAGLHGGGARITFRHDTHRIKHDEKTGHDSGD